MEKVKREAVPGSLKSASVLPAGRKLATGLPPRMYHGAMQWINYHHLLYFWLVAREGSIAKACRQLRLTQPTISAQIRALEDQLAKSCSPGRAATSYSRRSDVSSTGTPTRSSRWVRSLPTHSRGAPPAGR